MDAEQHDRNGHREGPLSDFPPSVFSPAIGKSPERGGATRAFPIRDSRDVVSARLEGRAIAEALGFPPLRAAAVALMVSELARNILLYAREGDVRLEKLRGSRGVGLAVIAEDHGPGMESPEYAVLAGYSTSGGLGLGLPGVVTLSDEFQLTTAVGQGVIVQARLWLR